MRAERASLICQSAICRYASCLRCARILSPSSAPSSVSSVRLLLSRIFCALRASVLSILLLSRIVVQRMRKSRKKAQLVSIEKARSIAALNLEEGFGYIVKICKTNCSQEHRAKPNQAIAYIDMICEFGRMPRFASGLAWLQMRLSELILVTAIIRCTIAQYA